jgi:aminoglycoside phosphotransferase (APT) family kinase protein
MNRCHNLLIDGEDLVAILDWELGQIGNPAADLGYIRGWVSQVVPWQRFMAAYHDAGGPPVSTHTLDFYTLWCGVRLYCLLLQARAGIAQGVVCDTEIAYAYAQFLPLLLRRIAHEFIAVLGRDPS